MSRAPRFDRRAPSRHLGVRIVALACGVLTACGEGPTTPIAPPDAARSAPAPVVPNASSTREVDVEKWRTRIPSAPRRESIPGADPASLTPIPSR
jgi:hypothetical protein